MSNSTSSPMDIRDIMPRILDSCFINPDIDKFAALVSDEEYIQHNPNCPDGKEAMLAFLGPLIKNTPEKAEVAHVIVDGDIGVAFCYFVDDQGRRVGKIADMFRIADGKIVEHWDVMTLQTQPADGVQLGDVA